jgi:hypothetical protein
MKAEPDSFLKAVAPFRQDLAVAIECIFTWYWLADLCANEEIPFGPENEIFRIVLCPSPEPEDNWLRATFCE